MAKDKAKNGQDKNGPDKKDQDKAKKSGKDDKRAAAGAASAAAFDIDNPEFPKALDERALKSGACPFPYDDKLKRAPYEDELQKLQLELIKLQNHVQAERERLVVVFEGRDTSGKGGCISRILERINPRHSRSVALSKPTDAERGQWYFQRYINHLPTRGDMVLFDRSWYNRAGVEKVMGFATANEVKKFLDHVPRFEKMLVEDGILLFKYWLACDQDKQEERLAERLADPLKRWKLSPIDIAAREKYDEYTAAREAMLEATHSKHAPWTLVDFNDQRLGRLTLIRDLLDRLPDTVVEPVPIDMPPLDRAPRNEEFTALKPLKPFKVP